MIRANECKLEGSPEVERLGLNNVFEFDIKIQLKAISDPRGLRDRIAGRSEVHAAIPCRPLACFYQHRIA
jgi:hypothetical protein